MYIIIKRERWTNGKTCVGAYSTCKRGSSSHRSQHHPKHIYYKRNNECFGVYNIAFRSFAKKKRRRRIKYRMKMFLVFLMPPQKKQNVLCVVVSSPACGPHAHHRRPTMDLHWRRLARRAISNNAPAACGPPRQDATSSRPFRPPPHNLDFFFFFIILYCYFCKKKKK